MGTFWPIKSENIEEHVMHSEFFTIAPETVAAIRKAKDNHHQVVAVGTTVTRTLEFQAKEILNQMEAKELSGEADIFIYPGYKFKVVDMMVTNFHAPRSTVLMMASAFAGAGLLSSAYQFAIKNDFCFLSYGDSMLII
jgi:S-adenosylmethionine:tRNA ribosyltransferase-isomerase